MINQHKTIKENIEKYNKSLPLIEELIPLVEGKRFVDIADIASGAFSKIGRELKGTSIHVYPSDKQDFTEFYKKHKVTPLYEIEHQDMEHLMYPDEFFDIVYCSNSLDHTKDAYKAVEEMIRVCKKGGWVYIECWLNQKDTGHLHYWNAKEDGSFTDGNLTFDLKKFGFDIEFIDIGGESRYNKIIAKLKK